MNKNESQPAPTRAGLRMLRNAMCIAAAVGLTGCATTMDFSSWAVSYNNSVESATNRMTLLNIMRASEDMPLLFTGMMVVRGQGTAAAGATLGGSYGMQTGSQGVAVDILARTWAPGASLQVSSGFNFDVVVLDSAEFYQGLLNPVSIDALHALSKRGVPTELILYLMIDRITLTVNGVSETFVNEPSDPNYERFRKALTVLLGYGLTTEQDTVNTPMSPLLSADDVKKNMQPLFQAAQAGIIPTPVPGGFMLMKKTTTSRLCFMGVGPNVPDLPQSSLCSGSPKKRPAGPAAAAAAHGEQQTLTLPDAQMTVQTRSTRDIYGYLGRLARTQTDAGREGVTLELSGVPTYRVAARGKSLFRVVKNDAKADDLVSVEYRGAVYSLPNEGYTSTVLAVLQQFFNLSKSINSVPNVGTVVVR